MSIGVRYGEIAAQLPYVDDPDVVERAQFNRALWYALKQARPENWWGTGLAPDAIVPIAAVSSIAVVWVPPARVIQALAASPVAARRVVLQEFERDVIADCRRVLEECDDAALENDQALIARAFDAFEAGHHEAAMALGAAVGEPLAAWASHPRVMAFDSREDAAEYELLRHGLPKSTTRDEIDAWKARLAELKKQGISTSSYGKYSIASTELRGDAPGFRLPTSEWRKAFISPIPHFFTPFYGRDGEPIPNLASRHATVHQPTVDHLNPHNALTTLMLVTSILREQQEWATEVAFLDHDD